MKKLLGILLIIVFAFSLYFSISNDVVIKSSDSPVYANLHPFPVPQPPPGKGC